MTATERLAEVGRGIDAALLPASVVTVAKHCLLDWLGVTLAGAREPVARIVYEQACRPEAGGECALLGFETRASVLGAALVHGTAAHALDYDDTHWGLQGHPTAPVLSALWGLCERERVSGLRLLAALVAGVEVECRLGRWLNPRHYALGFHATGTLGTFGAAAAVAHLLRLDGAAWITALGLAGTQASGLKSAFGSMAKPLHVGRAAQTGLLSGLLAAGGFSANGAILDDPQGFPATHGLPAGNLPEAQGFEILETLFKYHAACHLTHAAIEGVHALRRQQPWAATDVERVDLTLDETCLGVCAIERPVSGMQAKFSLKATTAMALLGDATEDPRTFDDTRATAPELQAWLPRVQLHLRPMAATRTEVLITLRDGRTLETDFDSGVPDRDLARQGARLRRKFERLAPLSAAGASAICDLVEQLEQLPDVRALHAALAK